MKTISIADRYAMTHCASRVTIQGQARRFSVALKGHGRRCAAQQRRCRRTALRAAADRQADMRPKRPKRMTKNEPKTGNQKR